MNMIEEFPHKYNFGRILSDLTRLVKIEDAGTALLLKNETENDEIELFYDALEKLINTCNKIINMSYKIDEECEINKILYLAKEYCLNYYYLQMMFHICNISKTPEAEYLFCVKQDFFESFPQTVNLMGEIDTLEITKKISLTQVVLALVSLIFISADLSEMQMLLLTLAKTTQEILKKIENNNLVYAINEEDDQELYELFS